MEDVEGLATRRRTIEHLMNLFDAIRAIAEIAWRRAEQRFQPLAQYQTQLQAVLQRVLTTLDPEQQEAVLRHPANGRPVGVLFVTSERGLCGPFNERLVSHGLQHAQALTAQGHTVRLLCLGSRGQRLFAQASQPLVYAQPLPSLVLPTYVELERIVLDLLDMVEHHTFGRLVVVSNAPSGRFQYEVTVRPLFPPAFEPLPRAATRVTVKPAHALTNLLTHLLTEHVLIGLYHVVIASAMSEQLARIYTMRLATENARKLVDKLTLDYNLARSHAVTQSLLEIVAGYDATQGR